MDTTKSTVISRRTALKLLVGAGAFLAVPATRVFGETEDELREQANQTQSQIDATQQQYNEAKARLDALGAEYQALVIEQAKTLDQIYAVEEDIRNVEAEIDTTQGEIEKREAELVDKQERLSKRISTSYKSGGTDFLQVLLSSATFDDLVSNIYYLDKITESDAQLIAEVRGIREELAQKKAQLEVDRNDLEEMHAQLEELNAQQQVQIEGVRAKQAEISDLINGLDAKVRELMVQRDEQLMAAEREAQRAREAEAAARAAAEAQAQAEAEAAAAANASTTTTTTTTTTSTPTTTPVPSYSAPTRVDVSNLTQGASGSQAAVINACYTVPSPGGGLCAWWVEDVFEVAGIGSWGGNACDLYYNWCFSSNKAEIQPGMIIAVSTYPGGGLGSIYGHVGIYVGDGLIRENLGYINTNTLDNWIALYSGSVTVRWGWMGGVKLA